MIENPKSLIPNAPLSQERRLAHPVEAVQAAFWTLWAECRLELQRRCRDWMGADSKEDVEDVLSAAMLHAFERFPAEPLAQPKAWLFSVVRNHCMDQHRSPRKRHMQRLAADALARVVENLPQIEEEGLEAVLERSESASALRQLVEQLPERLRAVMRLLLDDYRPDEISLELGITAANVRKRAEEGRAELKAMLQFGWVPPRAKAAPDETPVRANLGRRADGQSVSGYRAPGHAHVLRSVDGSRLVEPIVCFATSTPERLEQRSKTLEKYVVQHPTGHVKRLELAELQLLQGHWRSAMALLRTTLAQQPGLALTRLRLALLHHHLSESNPALDLLAEAARLPLPRTVAALLLGAQALCAGDLVQAQGHWHDSHRLSPDWPLPLHGLVGLAFQQHDLASARTLVGTGLAAFPHDRVLHFWQCCLPGPAAQVLQAARTMSQLFPDDGIAALQLRRACLLAQVAPPLPGRPERSARFDAVDLDLQLVAAAVAGKTHVLSSLLGKIPEGHPDRLVWQAWMDRADGSEMPCTPLARTAPVLPL